MLISFFIYLISSFAIYHIIAKLSYRFKLLDIPTKRKSHDMPTPYTGGLALGLIYVLAIKLFNLHSNEINLILSFSFIMMLVGLIDDKYKLNVGGKLSLQLFPISYLIVFYNLNLVDFGNYDLFKTSLGNFSIPFTLACIFLMINAANYFDGVDGVLSSTLISTFLTLLFLISNDENLSLLIIILILPVFIYLFFNFSLFGLPKMFLGDSGSLQLGFILSFLLIYIAKTTNIHPITLAWSVSLFVFEFLSVNTIRIKEKRKIFESGKDHLHFILKDKFKSKLFVNFTFVVLNISMFCFGYLISKYLGNLTSLIFFILFCVIFIYLRLINTKNKII
jgi:UDP-GlcNAc:undecaprenyl-phosphate GlcNAc-1-phosphate transferase